MIKISALVLVIIIFSCKSENDNSVREQNEFIDKLADTPPSRKDPSSIHRRVEIFNDIYKVRAALSMVGIGDLGTWKNDGMGGYMSITGYHSFGGGQMPNNIAYYLSSEEKSSVESVKLVMNINNSSTKGEAVQLFSSIASKTMSTLGIIPSKEFVSNINSGRPSISSSENADLEFKIVKSNIDTWDLVITSK